MPTYLRFVTPQRDEDSGVRAGFLGIAYSVMRDPDTPHSSAEAIRDLIKWFEKNLAIPDRFTSTTSKGWYRRTGRAISWFKPEAMEAITHARALAGLLEGEGVPVTVIRTARPGTVTFEDDHQIVAEPFADTAT